jgi:hypothetical protein
VDALLELARQERRAHPGHVGGPAGPSQQLRQSTPPEGLSVEATRRVQQASVKLFQQLGLRDYAHFGGWVLPPREERPSVWQRLEAEQQQQQQQQQGTEQQQQRGSSFAELQAIDAAARAESAAAVAEWQGAADAAGISSTDRATATDTTAEEAAGGSSGGDAQQAGALSKAGEGGGAGGGGDYGWFNGILLDDSVRPTSDEILAEGPFGRCERGGLVLAAWQRGARRRGSCPAACWLLAHHAGELRAARPPPPPHPCHPPLCNHTAGPSPKRCRSRWLRRWRT